MDIRPWPFVLGALLLTGCVATQRDILDLSQQTDSITLKVHELKKLMGQLQGNQADLNVRLDELRRDVSVLNENLKDNRDAMSRLSAKMDDLGAALGMKVSSLGRSIDESKDILRKTGAQLKQEADERRKAEATLKKKQQEEDEARRKAEAAAKAKAAEGPTPSRIYHTARVQLGKKQYDLAAEGFGVYLEKYPKGEVADLATYYLGQTRYSQKRWEDAARQFALVLDRYPKSDVTPAARLRYALSLMKMKTHLDEAKRYLQSIPHDFPKTPEADKAKGILRDWKAKKKTPKKKSRKRATPDGAR